MTAERLLQIMKEYLPPESESEWRQRMDQIIGLMDEEAKKKPEGEVPSVTDSVLSIFDKRVDRDLSSGVTGYHPNAVDRDAIEGRTARKLNLAFTQDNWKESCKEFSAAYAFVLTR